MRALVLLLVATMLCGCGPVPPELPRVAGPDPAEPTPKASYTMPAREPTWAPIATVAPSGHARPYTVEMIAERMSAESTTMLPTPLRTDLVAAALADVIWSYDGRPYALLLIQGSCADDGLHCDVSATGIPPYAPDRNAADVYWFEVDLRTGIVGPGDHGLRGFPPELVPAVDAVARSVVPPGRLEGTNFISVEWALPPPAHAFASHYRLGDLEGSRTMTVVIDLDARSLVSIDDWICCG